MAVCFVKKNLKLTPRSIVSQTSFIIWNLILRKTLFSDYVLLALSISLSTSPSRKDSVGFQEWLSVSPWLKRMITTWKQAYPKLTMDIHLMQEPRQTGADTKRTLWNYSQETLRQETRNGSLMRKKLGLSLTINMNYFTHKATFDQMWGERQGCP